MPLASQSSLSFLGAGNLEKLVASRKSVSKTLNLINVKVQHIQYLKDDLRYKKVEEQLTCKNIQAKIKMFEVIPLAICKSIRISVGQVGISFIPKALVRVPINEY